MTFPAFLLLHKYLGFIEAIFVLENNGKHFSTESLSQPSVLENGYFQAFALEFGVQVGVNGTTHAFQYDEVHALFSHGIDQQLK